MGKKKRPAGKPAEKKTKSGEQVCNECGMVYHYSKHECPGCGTVNRRHPDLRIDVTAEFVDEFGDVDEAINTVDQILEWVNNVGSGDLNKAREYLLRLRKIRGEA